MQYDMKITGGTIVDGTGKPGYRGDVGIRGGKIVALGRVEGEAATTIDATDRIVAPGFVDIHTHYDAQIAWDRLLSISPWHGVTTVVMGNCGFGVAPTRPEHRDLIVNTLEKVEGMSVTALKAGMGEDWGFETFPEYLDKIEKNGIGINVGVLIGHTPLRLYVMGEEATQRAATPEELDRMRAIVSEALEAGAVGVGSSKSPNHVGYAGKPVPSRVAEMSEIRALAQVMGEKKKGVLQFAAGNVVLDDLADISKSNDISVCWTALLGGRVRNGISHRDQLKQSLDYLERGYRLYPQVTPRPLLSEVQLKAPFVFENMPVFAPVSAADFEGKKALYRDPEFRKAFRDAVAASWKELQDAVRLCVIAECKSEPGLDERMLSDVAKERGVHPVDLILDLSLATNLEARFRMPFANYIEDEVEEVLRPEMVLGLSDAGAHASQLCDACQGTYLLSRWVREKKALSLETAVYMLTARTADVFGITDRGRLQTGLAADVVVFDADTIGASPLKRLYDFPGGADRLVSEASGIDAVIVNGTVLRRNGRDQVDPAGKLPGRLLRHGAAA